MHQIIHASSGPRASPGFPQCQNVGELIGTLSPCVGQKNYFTFTHW